MPRRHLAALTPGVYAEAEVDRESGALREDEEDGEKGGGQDAQLDH